MKTLLIMRHAKSSWKDAALGDHERPLNKRGQRDAPRAGRWLREAGLVPDALLASTAVRARATAALVAEAAGYSGDIALHAGFYHDAPAAIFDALQRLPAGVETALVIGHNPALEEMLADLTGDDETLTTAAVAHVNLPIPAWDHLSPDTEGVLNAVWRPRDA
jgi:phosphohistidine phosphatase